MGTTLKQQIAVENVNGAGGTIGTARVAKAQPDGYTVLLMHIGIATAPALYRKLPYDANDLEPIGRVADVPMTMVAKKTLPPNSLKEFLTYARANKDKLNYANAGVGSSSHLCGLLFMNKIGMDFNSVPYKGNAPAMTDLIGGQVDLMCDQTTNTTEQIRSGTIKVYGVTSNSRLSSMPDVPTLDEQGLKGFEVVAWYGLWAPKGTPKAALDSLNHALQMAVGDSTFGTRMADLGAVPATAAQATPDALRNLSQIRDQLLGDGHQAGRHIAGVAPAPDGRTLRGPGSSIVKPALGTAKLCTGDGLGELGQIIGISISDTADHECKNRDRGKDQSPVQACAGFDRIIHDGLVRFFGRSRKPRVFSRSLPGAKAQWDHTAGNDDAE
jgi:tripartite-type tricarboxylate transporter receptor subunit TctC